MAKVQSRLDGSLGTARPTFESVAAGIAILRMSGRDVNVQGDERGGILL